LLLMNSLLMNDYKMISLLALLVGFKCYSF